MALLEEPVPALPFPAPTLYIRPTVACPRCDGRQVLQLEGTHSNPYHWHECEDCKHLWALPRGWAANKWASSNAAARAC